LRRAVRTLHNAINHPFSFVALCIVGLFENARVECAHIPVHHPEESMMAACFVVML
jgi:hypothetical protein